METRYQRVAREQAERKSARESAQRERDKQQRKLARWQRIAASEKRYSDALVSDHDYSMNG